MTDRIIHICIEEKVTRNIMVSAESLESALAKASELYENELWEEMQNDAPEVSFTVVKSRNKRGRPRVTRKNIPSLFLKHYALYEKGSLNITELAKLTQLSRPTIYKYIDVLGHTKE